MPDFPVLLAAAVALVLVVAVALRRRHLRQRPPSPEELGLPSFRPRSEDEERRELGIVEVRARATPRTSAVPAPRASDAPPIAPPIAPPVEAAGAPEPVAARPDDVREGLSPMGTTGVGALALPSDPPRAPSAPVVTSAARRPRRDEDLSPEETTRAAQEHLLNALLLASGAHTVVLLREETGTHRRYHIERIVSRNAFARPHGQFVSRTPVLADAPRRRTTLHRVGHGHPFPPDALGYYRETLTGLREALVTPLVLAGAPHLLVADAMQDGRLGGRRAKALVEATARLLENTPPPDALDVGTGDGLPALVDAPAQPSITDRIEAALDGAGTEGLALVLVHAGPRDASDTLPTGGALEQAEEALRAHLAADLPADARLDRFGDLTFAVFCPDTSPALDAWVERLHARLSGAYPDGHVAVGAVVYDGMAPMTAADLRSHALHALASAYDEATPVILG